MTLLINISIKGGPGSGNWGHQGIPGKVGGSSPRGAGLSPTSGKDWLQRYEKRTGKKHPTATKPKPKPVVAKPKPVTKPATPRKPGTPGRSLGPGSGMTDDRIREFFWNGFGGMNWTHATTKVLTDMKESTVDTLSEKSGADPAAIHSTIEEWAITSNDNSPEALSMQEAVSEEFGVPLSKWQKDKIVAVNASEGPVEGYMSRSDERAVLRAMYEHTQEELKKAGYKPGYKVTLFRGVNVEHKPNRRAGDIVDYKGNAMESWSIEKAPALDFAYRGDLASGIVLSMKVPVENILSTTVTGFGSMNQAEVVVLGNIPGSTAIINTLV